MAVIAHEGKNQKIAPVLHEGRSPKKLTIIRVLLTAAVIIILATVTSILYTFTHHKDYIHGCGPNISERTLVNKTIIRIWTSSLPHHTDYSFMALLFLDWNTTETRSCGGTIITKRSILTAGHCLYNTTTVDIILGVSNFSESLKLVLNTSGEMIIHTNFDPFSYDNDVAIIKLDKDLKMSNAINIVSLNFNYNREKTSGGGTVLGWGINMTAGLSEELLNKSVELTANEDCFNFYQQNDFETDDSKIICTLGPNGPCYSDSGSPLLLKNSQVGLVSAGDIDCTPNTPTRYMNVGYYRQWIESNANLGCEDSYMTPKLI